MIVFFIYRKLLDFRVKPNYKGALAKGTAFLCGVGCFFTLLDIAQFWIKTYIKRRTVEGYSFSLQPWAAFLFYGNLLVFKIELIQKGTLLQSKASPATVGCYLFKHIPSLENIYHSPPIYLDWVHIYPEPFAEPSA